MKLEVQRIEYGSTYTIGKLYVDGVFQCFTLEDAMREKNGVIPNKIKGATAIPSGSYKVIVDYSNRFKRAMPHVLDVPGFDGIRIHSGNSSADTEGCILLGTTWAGTDFIGNSRLAFDAFFSKLTGTKEEVTIKITNK